MQCLPKNLKVLLILSILAATLPVAGQDNPRALILTPVGEPKATAVVAAKMIAPVKCDSHNNLYFRISGSSTEWQEPVLKVGSADGTVTKYDPQSIAGLPKDFISSEFAFGESGDLYQIILGRNFDIYLAHFDSSGAVASNTKLNDVFNARALSVLPGGDIFVLAAAPNAGVTGGNVSFFTELIDTEGKSKSQKHWLKLPEDFQGQPTSDGKLYVLTGSKLTVYSQDAQKVAELQLAAPAAGMEIIDWKPARNSVFIQWGYSQSSGNSGPGFIVAIDPTAGNESALYRLSSDAQGGLACVTENGFLLTTVEPDGKLSLLKTTREAKRK